MKTFFRWTEAAAFLRDLIRQSTPIPGRGIAIERTAQGRRISCTASGSGGGGNAQYDGPFKVVDISDEGDGTEVMIYDGSDPDSEYAGWAYINAEKFRLECDFVPVSASGYLYLQSSWDDENEAPGEPEFLFSTDEPHPEEDVARRTIARIFTESGRIARICQYQHGDVHSIIWGTCAYEPGE